MTENVFRFCLVYATCSESENEEKLKFKEVIQEYEWILLTREENVGCNIDKVTEKLSNLCDRQKTDVILTFGGVGFSHLDVIPEATKCIIEREALGLTIALFYNMLDVTPYSLLSRGLCGIRGTTLIINLTEDIKHLQSCLQLLKPCLARLMKSLRGQMSLQDQVPQSHNIFDDLPGSNECNQQINISRGSDNETESQIMPADSQQILIMQVFEDEDIDETNEDQIIDSKTASQPDQYSSEPNCSKINQAFTELQDQDFSEELLSSIPNHARKQSFKNIIRADDTSCDLAHLHNYNLPTESVNDNESSNSETHKDILTTDILPLSNPVSNEVPGKFGKQNANLENYLSENNTSQIASHSTTLNDDVYNFDSHSESEEETCRIFTRSSKRKKDKVFKKARIYNNSDQNKEICFVPVGHGMTEFLQSHLLINGIYLNKGKRHVKKKLVNLMRQDSAVDKGTWERKGHKLERNRYDDYFEATVLGDQKREEIGNCRVRDEYVVNWYVWCPGHGNCLRKCGGYGECSKGCRGMAHKQDRHNCSFLVNLKIFLSDLTKWRVQLTGCHVPDDSPLTWQPPSSKKQRMDQSTRDFIISRCESQNVTTSNIQEAFLKETSTQSANSTLSKRKISRVMWGLKKKKTEKNVLNSNSADLNMTVSTMSDQEKITIISIPSSCQSNIVPQTSSLSSSVEQSQEQSRVIIINRPGNCESSNIDVSELIQNSELSDSGDMSSCDLRAVLFSLYNQP